MNTLYQENAKYIHNGVTYRSMSEREIAQKLNENNIPFYYDARFSTGATDLSPDFYIINPFTGKYFLWEHFGSFNIPSYGERMNDKLATYTKIDFIENDNLIVIFEHHLRDTNRIQVLIDQVIWR